MAAAVMAAAMLVAPEALAHEADLGVRVELDEATADAFQGVDIAVVASVTDQLVVTNTTSEVLEVLDDNGTPFLRIGPDGVFANITSPGWYQTNNPFGVSKIPETARPGAEPDWKKVAAEPSWGWFDHRLHPQGMVPPPQIVEAGEPAEFAQWRVPVRWRGADAEVTGSIVYRPVRGSILAELTSTPDVDGMSLAVLQGRVPGMFLDNQSNGPVVVLGAEGEPFLRFTRRAVHANLHSPSWLAAKRGEGADIAGVVVDPDLPPRWRKVSEAPRFGWIEPRAAYPAEEPPEDIIAARERARLLEWEIPLRAEGREIVATGATSWQPLERPAGEDEPAAGWLRFARSAAVGAALVGLLWLLRRRRTA